MITDTRQNGYSDYEEVFHPNYNNHDCNLQIETISLFQAPHLASAATCPSETPSHTSSANTACVKTSHDTCSFNTNPATNIATDQISPNTYCPNIHPSNPDSPHEPPSQPPSPNFNIDELWTSVRFLNSSKSYALASISSSENPTDIEIQHYQMEQNFQAVLESLEETAGDPEGLGYQSSVTPDKVKMIETHLKSTLGRGQSLSLRKDLHKAIIVPWSKFDTTVPSDCTPSIGSYQIIAIDDDDSTHPDYETTSVGMDVQNTFEGTLLPMQPMYFEFLINTKLCESRCIGSVRSPFAANFLTILRSKKSENEEQALQKGWIEKARFALKQQLSMPRHDVSVNIKKEKLAVLRHFGFLFYTNQPARVEVRAMEFKAPTSKSSIPLHVPSSSKSVAGPQKTNPEPSSPSQGQPRSTKSRAVSRNTESKQPSCIQGQDSKIHCFKQPAKKNTELASQMAAKRQQENGDESNLEDALAPHFQDKLLASWNILDAEHIVKLADFSTKVYRWAHYEVLKDYGDSLATILKHPVGSDLKVLPHRLWTPGEMLDYWAGGANDA